MINYLFFEKTDGGHKVTVDLLGATEKEIHVTNDGEVLEIKIKDTSWRGWIPKYLDAETLQTKIDKDTLEIRLKEKPNPNASCSL